MKDLILTDISKAFGEKSVIKHFSHRFESGRVTVISGQSGCGKTTLLNLIAGLTSPDSGSMEGVPDTVSYVFQEDRLCEDFTALANIRLVCGKRLSKEAILTCLGELGITDGDKRPVKEYSGGMKRRVAIARALCHNADCVLLDEPFKGLDDTLKKDVIACVLRRTAGKTVICVTHDAAEAEMLGGRNLFLTREDA